MLIYLYYNYFLVLINLGDNKAFSPILNTLTIFILLTYIIPRNISLAKVQISNLKIILEQSEYKFKNS